MIWGGLKGFTLFYFTPQLSIILFAPLYPDVIPSLRVVFLIVPSFLWIGSSIARILYRGGWESLVKVLHSQVMWRRKQDSISLQVFCFLAHSQTPPVGPEQILTLTPWGCLCLLLGCEPLHFQSELPSLCKSSLTSFWCIILTYSNTTTSTAVSPQDLQKEVRDIQLAQGVEIPCWAQQGCGLIRYSNSYFWFHFCQQEHYFCW